MSRENGYDSEYPADYARSDRGSSAATGGSVYQPGVSERTLVAVILIPVCIALLGAMVAAWYAGYAGGNAVATANAALALAQISERNAKLAQYQLEEALKKLNIEVPNELPE